MKQISMRTIFAALVNELGYEEGTSIFEWYCNVYELSIEDNANATIKYEVLGI